MAAFYFDSLENAVIDVERAQEYTCAAGKVEIYSQFRFSCVKGKEDVRIASRRRGKVKRAEYNGAREQAREALRVEFLAEFNAMMDCVLLWRDDFATLKAQVS